MSELISKQAAIDAVSIYGNVWMEYMNRMTKEQIVEKARVSKQALIEMVEQLPPAQPDKDKVNNLLYHIYSIQSPHLDMTGVIAKKYYCEELWKELFGKESELPRWMS